MIRLKLSLLFFSFSMTACVSYNAQPIVTSPEERETIAQASHNVQISESLERAERRSERHEC